MGMMLNLFQFPLYMGMFFALRYMAFSPEAFSELHRTSFLYMDRIVEPDPYFLIPILSAVTSFLTIRLNKNKNKNLNSTPTMNKMMDVVQYLPFGAIFILGSYPAVLNMYWCTIAFTNLAFISFGHSDLFKKLTRTDKPYKGTVLYNQELSTPSKRENTIKANLVSDNVGSVP